MDWGRILDNRTPMAARCTTFDDAEGREILVAIAKMSWHVSPRGVARIAHPGAPIRSRDEHYDGPSSSLRRPSDFVPTRPGTSVVLVGTAHPARVGASHCDVRLRVGDGTRLFLDKSLRVYGPRRWARSALRVLPGPAGPLGPTPLRYEDAFGGDAVGDDGRWLEPRNPIGRGASREPARLVGELAPAIEDLAAPLGARRPAPGGFGPIPGHFEPRAARLGTHDETWRRERAPLLPLDHDPRAFVCSPDDQWLATPLEGDEDFEVESVRPEGSWRFSLPRYAPSFSARVAGREHELSTHLDTVLIDADEGLVELTWRARTAMPRKSEEVAWVRIFGRPELDSQLVADLSERVRRIADTELS